MIKKEIQQERKVLGDYVKPPDQYWTIPTDKDKGVYRFILAAARRARQLQNGSRTLISTSSRKSTKIAMEEVRSGAIGVTIVPEGEPWPPVREQSSEDAFSESNVFSELPAPPTEE